MFKDSHFLKFQGFHPSDYTIAYLNEKMEMLHEAAPYGSTLKAEFTRKDHMFKGVITIHSAVGKFTAVASGNKMKDVTHRLVEQIRRQLGKWKATRFRREVEHEKEHFGQNAS